MTRQSPKPKPRTYGNGGSYPLANGRWLAVIPLGKDATGKRLRWQKTAATFDEAESLRFEALYKRDRGALSEPNKQSVSQFLDHWLEMEVIHRLRPNTVTTYTSVIRNHLKPSLGKHALHKLTADHIQAMLNKLAKAGKAKGTLSVVKGTLVTALRFAERRGWVERNVAALVSLPNAAMKEAPFLTVEQAHAFTEAIRGHRYETYYWLLITTGLRLSEALGLRWRNIDFNTRTISITHSLYRKGGAIEWAPPKTTGSKTTVVLPDVLIPRLKAHKDTQEFMRRAADDEWVETDAVFANAHGLPYSRRALHQTTKRIMRQIGVPQASVHSLRHTYATLLLAEGTDIKTLSEALRHANVTTTMRVYAHVVPQLKQKAADTISRVFLTKANGL